MYSYVRHAFFYQFTLLYGIDFYQFTPEYDIDFFKSIYSSVQDRPFAQFTPLYSIASFVCVLLCTACILLSVYFSLWYRLLSVYSCVWYRLFTNPFTPMYSIDPFYWFTPLYSYRISGYQFTTLYSIHCLFSVYSMQYRLFLIHVLLPTV